MEAGVPDTQLTREATALLQEYSTPVLINHSHRVFFWANEMGRQTGQKFDVELVFICAAFHDLGLIKTFSSADDRFEVDSANADHQFLEHHGVPTARIQTAWDAIALHTTPGIAAYKPLEVELLYNGVALDSLGIGYETFPEDVRTRVVAPVSANQFQAGSRAGILLTASRHKPANDRIYVQRRHLHAFHSQLQADAISTTGHEFAVPKLLALRSD